MIRKAGETNRTKRNPVKENTGEKDLCRPLHRTRAWGYSFVGSEACLRMSYRGTCRGERTGSEKKNLWVKDLQGADLVGFWSMPILSLGRYTFGQQKKSTLGRKKVFLGRKKSLLG